MTFDPVQVYEWVSKAGLPGAMALFIWALVYRRLYTRGEVEDLKARMAEEYTRMKTYLEDRCNELAEERLKFQDMVIGAQHTAAKSMDILAESKKDR